MTDVTDDLESLPRLRGASRMVRNVLLDQPDPSRESLDGGFVFPLLYRALLLWWDSRKRADDWRRLREWSKGERFVLLL